MVAAAHVHTIKAYGPDRIAGFSPIPAMSMVSHAAGARFSRLLGGAMLSFYDWYADLPVASPQVFGDQTDVPESGDWWDAGYLIMWGSNLPVTRTPDAHWMAEARYRGQKVVAVAPDYADNVKFADEWLAPRAGHRRRAGHGDGARGAARSSSSTGRSRTSPTTSSSYTDLPFLVTLDEAGDGAYVPGKFLTAADLPGRWPAVSTPRSRRCCWTPTGRRWCRTVRSASATARPGRGSGISTSATSAAAVRGRGPASRR